MGDCYFLSALSVLAEKKEQVESLFYTHEYNKDGVYAVWLNINGEWRLIVIDD